MNSKSYIYDDYNDNCRKNKKCSDNNNREVRSTTIIKCSTPSTVAIPVLAAPGSTFPTNSLSLRNVSPGNCCTKLDFTSNISVPVGFLGTLRFQIFKQCRNQMTPVPVGPAFTFSRLAAVTIGTNDTFSFFVCDCDASCDDYDDCCTYSVVITNLSAITLGLTVNNATLSATSTCNERTCNC